ncbi:sialic acid-binding Ig-like lectin 6 isoform X2 [Trematomus bernacchii]|uniref:sialic acid-binding Ig-like lectin 6 isoform X2 n=1 Tax=Trematomus bernacchii TaxID=40690 RepID=UPI00146AD934|nr:sialic acid-binding Ig-like lectin 6 isoform X2 [Trematomus bernacchii]
MWATLVMTFSAVQSVRMVTANILLSLFFLSGANTQCQTHLLLTTPQEMEALNGSCLHVPCNFSTNSSVQDTFNGSRKSFGVWMNGTADFANNPDKVIFNSSKAEISDLMKITGDLSQRDCTTLFHSLNTSSTGRYFFRVEKRPFLATADCDSLEITVQDSPPSPRINISNPGDLKEAESVTVTCSAPAPCPHSPPKLTWTLQQDPPNTMEENPDRTFTTKIQKNVTLTDQHDGFNITCSASYPVNEGKDVKTAEETKTLHVSYAPKDTSASVSPSSGLVSAGSWVKLSCSSRAQPPVSSFTWFKESQDGDMNVSQGQIDSFNATEGGRYYCVATNELGNGKSTTILLTIIGVNFEQWGAVIGGTVGIVVLICLVLCGWRLMSTHPTAEQTQLHNPSYLQSQTGEELTVEEPVSKTEEEIHYGEIDFSKQRNKSPPVSEQDGGQTEDPLYAQVKVSETANRPEDLYAQVKKKSETH